MKSPPDGKPSRVPGLVSSGDALVDYMQSLLAGPDTGADPVQGDIDCEVFSVRGLVLAVRREDFAGVLELSDIGSMADGEDRGRAWLAECQPPGGRRLRLVLTERLLAAGADGLHAETAYRHTSRMAVLLSDGVTALAADELLGSRRLDSARVCWRTSRTTRIWLAGVAREDGVVLLDVRSLLSP
jgi:hypothetical protein